MARIKKGMYFHVRPIDASKIYMIVFYSSTFLSLLMVSIHVNAIYMLSKWNSSEKLEYNLAIYSGGKYIENLPVADNKSNDYTLLFLQLLSLFT